MDLEPWSKADERSLARYVDPESVKLRLDVNRQDLVSQPDGIRSIVEAIYKALLNKEIRYAPEKYFPDQKVQKIRGPEEMLREPGEGTCLDLALLFCAACLANDLLPMVIVIEGHALAAVSLTQLRGDWDAYERHECSIFDRGELSMGNKNELISLIDNRNYIAIECTGFAQSNTLPGGPPELAGRQGGVLTFDQAVVVGRAQLSPSGRPFQYALDIATLHELGVRPFNPMWAHLVKAIQSNTKLMPAEDCATLPRPQLRVRFDKLLERHAVFGGREKEMARLDQFVAHKTSGYFFITAASGFGKTALLANWTRDLLKRRLGVCYHFISRLDETRDETFALRNLCQQLAACHRLSGDLPNDLDDLRSLYPELLGLPAVGGQIVVILDGFDEALGWIRSSLFPAKQGRGVFIIFSARTIADKDWCKTLELPLPDDQRLVLQTLSQSEIASLLKAFGEPAARYAEAPDFLRAMYEVSSGDPFYLKYLAEDIRDARINDLTTLRQQPRGLNGYLDEWWTEVCDAGAAVRDLLGYLLVSKGPLSRDDLNNISQTDTLNSFTLKNTLDLVRRFVLGSEKEGYSFCHPRFREYIAEKQIKEPDQRPYRECLLDYCSHWQENKSKYALAHYPMHLVEAGRAAELRKLLFNFAWLQANLDATDPDVLIAGYDLLPSPTDETARLVKSALRLSKPALGVNKAQLPGQLLGRLMPFPQPEIQSLLEEARAWQGQLWLRPITADLTPPGTTLLATLDEPNGGIQSVTVSDDGGTVAFAVHDEKNSIPPAIRVWRVSGGTGVRTVSNIRASALALSPDGSVLAIAAKDAAVSLWSLGQGNEGQLYSFPPGPSSLMALTFINSDRLVGITEKGDIQTWDLASAAASLNSTVKLPEAFQEATFSKTVTIAFAQRARRLFTGRGFMSAEMLSEWSLDSCSVIQQQANERFWALAVTPDAGTLVTGAIKIGIWTRAGEKLQLSRTLPGHGYVIVGLAMTTDGARLVSATYSSIRVWDLVSKSPDPADPSAENYIVELAIRNDGKEALTKYRNGTWKTIDVCTREASLASALPREARLLGISYEESSLILGTGKDLLFWNPAAGQAVRLVVSTVEGTAVAITSDRRRAVTIANEQIAVWEVETRTLLARMEGPINDVQSIALFPDGSRLAAGGSNSVLIWDLKSGKLLRTLAGPKWFVDCVAAGVTPQGLRIVAGSRDKIVRVWDPEREQPLLALTGHTYTICDVQFLPGGEWFVSAAADNCLRVWNIATGRCETMYTADAAILKCVCTPDGSAILASDEADVLHYLEFAGDGVGRTDVTHCDVL